MKKNIIYLTPDSIDFCTEKNSTQANLVVVPGESVLFTTVKLPLLSPKLLVQSLPFALEEKLLNNLEELHFVIGERLADQSLSAAVVAHHHMKIWLERLREFQIKATSLVPLVFILPYCAQGETWHVLVQEERSFVRMNKNQGFCCENYNLEIFLQMSIAQQENKPDTLHLHQFASTNITVSLLEPIITETHYSKDNFHKMISIWATQHAGINLLQGPYRPKLTSLHTKKIWQGAAGFFTASIILLLLSKFISGLILQHALHKYEAMIAQIYTAHFPHATAIVAPRERMEAKINSLINTPNKNFIFLLNVISKSISTLPQVILQKIIFQENYFILNISADSFERVNSLIQSLQAEGANAKQQDASLHGTSIQASIVVRMINKGLP